jgi:hypothetical protein
MTAPVNETPTPAPRIPRAILLHLSEDQGKDLLEEALALTASEGRSVSPTEVVRRRTFKIGQAA